MPWEKEMDRARRGHRPSLKNWECDGLYDKFPSYVESVQRELNEDSNNNDPNTNDSYCMNSFLIGPKSDTTTTSSNSCCIHPPSLPVILDAETLDYGFFTSTLEAKGIPCIIQNIPTVEGWKCQASKSWELSSLLKDPALRNRKFKCGEDDDGSSIRVKLKHFLRYQQENRDDSPLYVFDSSFDEDKKAKNLLDDYKVPSFFGDDLFRLVSESRRPPYRWFLVGPKRSGTTVHIDPLATAAWNTLLVGQKRWVLFPPQVPKSLAKGKYYVYKGEDDESIHYFTTILPRIKRAAQKAEARNFKKPGDEDFENFACYEFTQNPGDTVFIPNGWWHGVLNITHTVGITQNFCSPRNFPQVWKKTRSGRKLLAAKWINQLQIHYPQLAQLARDSNIKDGFVMKYNPEVVRQRDEHKKKQSERREMLQQQQQQLSDDDNTTNNREHKRTRRDSSPNSVVGSCQHS